LFKIHHQVIKETTPAAMESNDEKSSESVAALQTPGVESIVKQEILMVLNAAACRGGDTVTAPSPPSVVSASQSAAGPR
jgi:hypothetical protein